MANLHDVIPVSTAKPAAKYEKEFNAVVDEANSALAFLKKINVPIDQKFMTQLQISLGEIRKKSFEETLTMTKVMRTELDVSYRDGKVKTSFYERTDALGYMASKEQVLLSEMLRVAEALGMVIIPYEALDSRSLKAEPYYIREKAELFKRLAYTVNLDVYVIAPIELYNVLAHVKMEKAAFTWSKRHDVTMQTINLQLPLFKALNGAINSLDSRVTALEATQNIIQTQLQSLQEQMSHLQSNQNRARKQEFLKTQSDAGYAEVHENSFSAMDPLMFAVPAGTRLTAEDAISIIGPCWGPEFDDILLQVSQLKIIPKQRKKLETDF